MLWSFGAPPWGRPRFAVGNMTLRLRAQIAGRGAFEKITVDGRPILHTAGERNWISVHTGLHVATSRDLLIGFQSNTAHTEVRVYDFETGEEARWTQPAFATLRIDYTARGFGDVQVEGLQHAMVVFADLVQARGSVVYGVESGASMYVVDSVDGLTSIQQWNGLPFFLGEALTTEPQPPRVDPAAATAMFGRPATWEDAKRSLPHLVPLPTQHEVRAVVCLLPPQGRTVALEIARRGRAQEQSVHTLTGSYFTVFSTRPDGVSWTPADANSVRATQAASSLRADIAL